jgi:hypothetical protein
MKRMKKTVIRTIRPSSSKGAIHRTITPKNVNIIRNMRLIDQIGISSVFACQKQKKKRKRNEGKRQNIS